MLHARSLRRALATLLLAAPAAVAVPAAAQSAPSAAPALDGARLQPGRWTYTATMERDSASIQLARRVVTVSAADYQGTPAWLLVDETNARGQVMPDSVWVRRDDLAPLARSAVMGPLRLAVRAIGDSLTGALRAPGAEEAPIALSAPPGTMLNAAMLEAALTLLPLRAGWTGTLHELAPGPTGAALVPVTLAVTGEEAVTVPAGTIPCWVMTAGSAGVEQRLWVAKADGRLVRRSSSPPQAPDVRYETVLVQPARP
ncbi:MAG TPA: hypothetical protein VFS08_04780 [Gemmatimonadaceae bacterium]|nr:hypothetical protein [Gemmatimonadaceae bacterium]